MTNNFALLGQMPALVKATEDFVSTGTKSSFLFMVGKYWDVISKVARFIPAKDKVLVEAGKMWDGWKKE